MASKSRPTQLKRQRERAQAERRTQKDLKRQEAKARRANATPRTGDEDPDIAGIIPGPQPHPFFDDDLDLNSEE
jgi:sRNA-binding protein